MENWLATAVERQRAEFPPVLYRFFDEEAHRDSFINGRIRISTLNACRAYETPGQGDPDEAIEHYATRPRSGSGNDPQIIEMASRAGIRISGGSGATVNLGVNTRAYRVPDAYVLCMTMQCDLASMSSTFGNYCAEIVSPAGFFRAVSNRLYEFQRIHMAKFGPVVYRSNRYEGLDDRPGEIGFVKATSFSPQCEYRFLWLMHEHNALAPVELDVPEAIGCCLRLDL